MCKALWLLLSRSWPRLSRPRRRSLGRRNLAGNPTFGAPAAAPQSPPPLAGELQQLVDTLQNDHAPGEARSTTPDADRGAAAHRAPEIGGGGSPRALVQPDRRLHRRGPGRRRVDRRRAAADPLGARANSQRGRPRALGDRGPSVGIHLRRCGGDRGRAALDHCSDAAKIPGAAARYPNNQGALCLTGADPRPSADPGVRGDCLWRRGDGAQFIDPDRHHDVGPRRGDDRGAADPVSRARSSDPARRGRLVPAARRRNAQLSLHLGQTLHLLGRLRLCGS